MVLVSPAADLYRGSLKRKCSQDCLQPQFCSSSSLPIAVPDFPCAEPTKRFHALHFLENLGKNYDLEGINNVQIPVGVVLECGSRQYMEDTYVEAPLSAPDRPGQKVGELLGVFDGHGGASVAQHCAARIPTILQNCLSRHGDGDLWEGHVLDYLKETLMGCDRELRNTGKANFSGSTAIVSVVTNDSIHVANCGDSRAVLSRKGVALPLSEDQKPERPDEQERIQQAGGKVWWRNGYRVMGALAMSRAIGDHCLQPFGITPEPEVLSIQRSEEDDFLILASDGLWAALSSQEAVDLGMICVQRAFQRGATQLAAARIAANVLMKAALKRGSQDNITVLFAILKASDGANSLTKEGRLGAHCDPDSPSHADSSRSASSCLAISGSQPSEDSTGNEDPREELTGEMC